MITILDFQTTAYKVSMPETRETVRSHGSATHHKQDYGQRFSATDGGSVLGGGLHPIYHKLDLNPGNDTVFLPYYANQAASVRLPASGPVQFFVTSNLSGCAIYIGVNNHGRLVVVHSNSQTGSDKATMEANPPNFQLGGAVTELDRWARYARDNHHSGLEFVSVLSKARYLKAVNALCRVNEWMGGVTVAGWRTLNTNNWQFRYQVYGSINNAPIRLVACEEFYRNF